MHTTTINENLNRLLADATVFYQKLRHYHWNVTGPRFYQLHELFEGLYTAWADAIDEIAERIRQLGGTPVHTLAGMLDLASIAEDPEIPHADVMLDRTVADLEALHASLKAAGDAAESAGDRVTTGLVDGLGASVEKTLWMLHATQGS